jgi:hypothetical protein
MRTTRCGAFLAVFHRSHSGAALVALSLLSRRQRLLLVGAPLAIIRDALQLTLDPWRYPTGIFAKHVLDDPQHPV